MKLRAILILLLLIISLGCGVSTDTNDNAAGTTANALDTTPATFDNVAGATPATFFVELPCVPEGWLGGGSCESETIEIPNGRPIYALLVSGFHQNKELDMFHFYNFAKCLLKRGAYVHYAWWNNLLAPWMERPLHDPFSVPSTSGIPLADMLNVLPIAPSLIKARPRDDIQFQADARALLTAIRENNPDAAIIIVGHSFGGNSVARLADSVDNDYEEKGLPKEAIDIALLAPIDPVGNRSCIRDTPLGGSYCNGLFNFTRWRATHLDWQTNTTFPVWLYDPPQRAFTDKVNYLYHRWQQEFSPPFDYSCPPGGTDWPCLSGKSYDEYLFIHPGIYATSIWNTPGATNIQSMVQTSEDSYPSGGDMDGHGEIVGFRGVYSDPFGKGWVESYPLGLQPSEEWPSRAAPVELIVPVAPLVDVYVPLPPFDGWPDPDVTASRVQLMKAWDADPYYLDDNGYAPQKPGDCDDPESDYCTYCMVSGDLCEILRTAVNAAPVADAGPDQTVECSGPDGTEVTLDGSGSTDPNDDTLTFTWTGPFGTMTGETIHPYLPLGTHTITLTVDDGRGQTDSDTVDVTVMDSTPPSLSVSLSPTVLWPPNHKLVSIAASIQSNDICGGSPNVELVSIIRNEADNHLGDGNTNDDIQGASLGTDDRTFSLRAERSGKGAGRVYTVTYRASDLSGNIAEQSAEVTVPHDQGGVAGLP